MDVFVGREAPRATLSSALSRALAGAGGSVLVSGAAGIGKTRLVSHALAAAPVPAVWAAAREPEGSVPYRVWRPVLRAVRGGAGAALDQLLHGTRAGAAADRADLHDDVAALLARAAYERPLVVVLEDLHWADADSLALLDTVLPALRSAPALVVGTSRSTTPGGQSLRFDVDLRLPPLSPHEVAELADALGAPAHVRDDVHARTGGNPLHVRELVHAVVAGHSDLLPPSLAADVGARLRAAGPDAAAVAAATAVLGEEARLDQLLAVAAGAPGGHEERHRAGLRALLDARLLVPVPGAVLRYRFPHALLREAVLARLDGPARAAASAAAAEVLCAAGAPPGLVAPHVVSAANGGLLPPAAALEAVRAAAAEAERVRAWEQAASLRRDAAEWAAAAGAGGLALAVLEHADALARAGRAEQARQRHLEAAALARNAGQAEVLALASLGLSGGLGGVEVPMRDHEQVALLDEALAALPPGSLRAHVRARRSVAVTYLQADTARAGQALEALDEAADDLAAVAALSALSDARSGPQHVAERLRIGGEMVARGARAGSPEHQMLGLRVRLVAELERGDIAAAEVTVAQHGQLAERLGQSRYRWYSPLWRGALALLHGDVAAARVANAEAARLGERARSTNAVMLTLSQLGCLLIVTRDATSLRGHLEPVVAEYPELCGPRVALAWALLHDGEQARAAAALDHLVDVDLPQLPVDAEWLPTVALLGETVARLDDQRLAAPLLEALVPYRRLFIVDGIADAVMGSTGRVVGALAAAVGRWELAEEALADALQDEERAGATGPAADTRELWGTALLRTGRDLPRGRELLQQGRAWRAAAGLAQSRPAPEPDVAVLTAADGAWAYVRGDRRATLPGTRGLDLLAVLLERPDAEVSALDLDGRSVLEHDLGAVLDPPAQRAYRRRLAELDEAAAQAREARDAQAVAAVRHERDALEQALRGAAGLQRRPRPQGASAERARTAVTKALRDAVRRLAQHDPLVGEHLAVAVRTGSWCCYRPDPASRVTCRVVRPSQGARPASPA